MQLKQKFLIKQFAFSAKYTWEFRDANLQLEFHFSDMYAWRIEKVDPAFYICISSFIVGRIFYFYDLFYLIFPRFKF